MIPYQTSQELENAPMLLIRCRSLLLLIGLLFCSPLAFADSKNDGGAWDFEGKIRQENILLALEATRAHSSQHHCEAELVAEFVARFSQEDEKFLPVLKEKSPLLLEEHELNCLVQAVKIYEQK